MIHKHNLEADLGLHTYTLGINSFSDMVNIHYFFSSLNPLIHVGRQTKCLHMSLKDQVNGLSRETFVSPANFQLPDSIGVSRGENSPV